MVDDPSREVDLVGETARAIYDAFADLKREFGTIAPSQ